MRPRCEDYGGRGAHGAWARRLLTPGFRDRTAEASRALSLAASLDVALDELLGILFQDVVDLVGDSVDVPLQALGLVGQVGRGLRRRGVFLRRPRRLFG